MSSRDRPGAHRDNIFQALLRLHKALLDDERVSYERVHGRIPPTERFCNWCWKMRGLPGCVRCLK